MLESEYYPWPANKGEFIKIAVHNSSICVNPHMHDFIEIVLFAKGSCIHGYNNKEIVLIPGDTFVVAPHKPHFYDITTNSVIYNCLFYPAALGEDWKRLQNIEGVYDFLFVNTFFAEEHGEQKTLHLLPEEAAFVESLLKKMILEQEEKSAEYQLVLKANLILLIAMLGRTWEKQYANSNRCFSEKRNMLAEALNYLEDHYGSDLKVRDLASLVYLSADYFRKVFKEATGLSPIEYINRVRISKAAKMLEESELPVARVAEMVGVDDVNYFSRLFRAKLGCSPSEYRKRND